MVLTVSFVLSPVIGLSCHRHPADMALSVPGRANKTSAGLDAGVEASGPHDFTVREPASLVSTPVIAHGKPALPSRRVQNAAASTASHPASVTIAIRPSVGWDGGTNEVIWVGCERKYFCKWDWTGRNRLIRLRKIGQARNAHRMINCDIVPGRLTELTEYAGVDLWGANVRRRGVCSAASV